MPEAAPPIPVPGPSRLKVSRPTTQVMVDNALKGLNERTGSSAIAIKKFIASTYNVDVEKLSSAIKKYIKESLVNGKLIQTKGKGVGGSFKLSPAAKNELKLKSKEKKTKSKEGETSKKTAVKEKSKKKKVDSGDLGKPEKPSKSKASAKKDDSTKKAALPKQDASEKSKKILKPKKLTTKTTGKKNPSAKPAASAMKKKETQPNGTNQPKKKETPPVETNEENESSDDDGVGNELEVSLKSEIQHDLPPKIFEESASSEDEEIEAEESQSGSTDLPKKTLNKKKGKSAKAPVKKRKSIATLAPKVKPARFKLG